MRSPVVTFDHVSKILRNLVAERHEALAALGRITAVRDLWGRVRLVVPQRPEANSALEGALHELAAAMHERLGAHAHPAEETLLYADEMATEPPEGGVELDPGPPALHLVDRQLTGLDWGAVAGRTEAPPRIACYSLKGGVGRSTAIAVAAWHLARTGRRVLVLDLDLEAPGLSVSLLPADRQPAYGIADWLVEDLVDQGDVVLGEMVGRSPLAATFRGDILVVPSHGADPGEYLAKLGRCYLDLLGGNGPEPWSRRLARLLKELEARLEPDVVLLDSRAGLSDLAAAAVTDLGAEVLLFAIGTEQTWSSYRLLFRHWQWTGVIRPLRERLGLVAAQVPEVDREEYLEQLRQDSWDLFREHAYDEVPAATGDEDAFSFDLTDPDAPHAPVPIYWSQGIAALRRLDMLDEQLVTATFGRFLDHVDMLVARGSEAVQ